MNWIYTNILHNPRKALGISVLEYCVLDYVYKTQTHPEYGVNGWTKTGCHKIADFLGVSSGTVKGIFDRMDAVGLLERMGDDLKRATTKFYSIAYEQDVQKLNGGCSETERGGVQKLNGKRSETEQHIKEEKEIFKLNKKEVVELHSTVTLIDEVDETSVEIHHVPDYFDTEQKKPKEKSGAKKEKVKPDNPTPIKPMFEIYSDQYAKMNGGEKPEFMPKYLQPMKKLYGILEARQIQSGIVPLEKLQPWRDFIEMWGKYLQDHPKETYFTANFNPATFYSQFNTIVAKLKTQPMTTEDKWKKFYRENTTG